jgi:hypothetical protein
MMQVEGMPDGEITGSRVKIGAPSSSGRVALWAGVAVLGLGGVFAFYRFSASTDEPKMRALEDFRAEFAQKCNNAEFSGPAPTFLRDQFLNSAQLQDTVRKQATALHAGATCADVEQALRTASFPLAAKPRT